MFSRALLATDLSSASDAVVGYAALLRPLGCREIVLTHVLYVKHMVGLDEVLREEAASRIAAQKQALEAEGFVVSVEMPVGIPGPTIARVALDKGCSLIIIGSHGYGAARTVALGGVATDVVHRSEVPVLVVRLRIAEDAGEKACRVLTADVLGHVLYPTDFSDGAERAFLYVEKFVQSGCRRVTLLHVQDVSRITPYLEHRLEEFNAVDQARMDRLRERLLDLGAEDVAIEIPYGSPIKEILGAVDRLCPSILIMGSHGRGFVADIFLGSLSHNVVRHANVPVLLAPAIH